MKLSINEKSSISCALQAYAIEQQEKGFFYNAAEYYRLYAMFGGDKAFCDRMIAWCHEEGERKQREEGK
jgi:hypothetical protein